MHAGVHVPCARTCLYLCVVWPDEHKISILSVPVVVCLCACVTGMYQYLVSVCLKRPLDTDCAFCNSLTSGRVIRTDSTRCISVCFVCACVCVSIQTSFIAAILHGLLCYSHTLTVPHSLAHILMYLVKYILMTLPGPLNCVYECHLMDRPFVKASQRTLAKLQCVCASDRLEGQ